MSEGRFGSAMDVLSVAERAGGRSGGSLCPLASVSPPGWNVPCEDTRVYMERLRAHDSARRVPLAFCSDRHGMGGAALDQTERAFAGRSPSVGATARAVKSRRPDRATSRHRASLVALVALGVFALSAEPCCAADRIVACRLVVDGKVYVDGPCLVSPLADGSFSIGTGSGAVSPSRHFAYLTKTGPDTAEATWNEDPSDTHAYDPLGSVTRAGACWNNVRAQICAK